MLAACVRRNVRHEERLRSGWLQPFFEQHLPHRGSGDGDSDAPKLTDDAAITPVRVLARKPEDHCAQRRFEPRPTRTLRTDCLDRILILGRRHLEHALRVYRIHYNEHRPHRALDLLPPNGRDPTPPNPAASLYRRDLLGGLIHEYKAA
jgi:Integrase core domain